MSRGLRKLVAFLLLLFAGSALISEGRMILGLLVIGLAVLITAS